MSKRLFVCLLLSIFFGIFCFESSSLISQEMPANKAARLKINKTTFEETLAGQKAPTGKIFLVLETHWENIHPKQKIEKSKLEGKQDRTMGVGGLTGGGQKGKEEYVDADVAYQVPNFFDHAYCLADGKSYPLDKLTEKVPGGLELKKAFRIEKLGEKKPANFVYVVPKDAKNLAFQFFDYSNGHILVPIKGDLALARGAGGDAGKVLDQFKNDFIDITANKMDFQAEFKGDKAPEGWQFAVVELGGKSLSEGNIIQIRPKDYLWLSTNDGFLYYCGGATTTEGGMIRFTPEVYQNQEIAFLVPAAAKDFTLGVRVKNSVYNLKLNPRFQAEIPGALASHRDGETMEIFVYGLRQEGDRTVLDLGIQSLVNSGIEIQTSQQFILKTGEENISFDEASTGALFHRPPDPFTIPPQTFVRFELAYKANKVPTALYYRGYESEKTFELDKIRKS
jgi:CRISPR/Cas system-associated endoribonuclease Cas2